MKVKYFMVAEYNEIEKLVRETYGIDYESVADEEWNNDECHTFDISKPMDLDFDEWDEYQWKNFLDGKGMYNFRLVMRHLIKDGKLPLAEYLIEVSW